MDHKRGVVLGCVGLFLLMLVCTGGITLALLLFNLKGGTDTAKDSGVRPVTAATLPKATEKLPATLPKATLPKIVPPVYKPDGKQVPPEDELRKLLTGTILDVDRAVRAKDVKLLFPRLIGFWQRVEGIESLKNSLRRFEERPPAEFGLVADVAPKFDKPAVLTKEGEFSVSGSFPTTPNPVYFKFTYVFEGGDWKLGNWGLGTAPLP
ncbi:MAG: hypothetical protein JNM56_02140 [Planctomycetia bacterium]|nr:hypothetical protein [Planctomycetia bacterium]